MLRQLPDGPLWRAKTALKALARMQELPSRTEDWKDLRRRVHSIPAQCGTCGLLAVDMVTSYIDNQYQETRRTPWPIPRPSIPTFPAMLAPVRSEDDFELKVVGRIPDALAGAYYRNGPNPQFDPQGPYLAFLGDGMIHGFFLEPNKDGGRARYRNRWVRTPRWQAENKAGRPLFGVMGAPSDPSVANVDPGAANTNIVHHAGKLMALHEQSEPFEVDPAGLERGGFMNTGGKFTAHPKMDPETGEMVWFAYFAGPQPFSNLIDYGVTDKTGKVTRRDRFAAPYASMIHDFMVTRNYVMFPVLPLTGDLQRAMKGLPPLAWEPAKGAFIGVMKRNARVDSIRWFEIEPSFVLHAMNAWEDGEKIHCELMEYPNAPVFPNADGSPGRDARSQADALDDRPCRHDQPGEARADRRSQFGDATLR